MRMEQREESKSGISRRSFLRTTAGGGAAALLAVCALMVVPTVAAAPRQQQQPGPKASGKRDRVARERTVIAEQISGRNPNPEVFNPFIVNIIQHTGLQQAAIEPIQYINMETGKEEPWQIEKYTFDPGFTGVTLTVRPGVMWSDGVPFGPTDIAYTLNMLKNNAPELTFSGDVQKWVAEATAVNERDAHITFTSPNPRF